MAKRGDPRWTRAYSVKAKAFIDLRRTQPIDCALCGEPVNMQAPSTTPTGPTVEHRIPVRALKRMAKDRAELIRLTCDEQWWAIAHKRCQDRQGALARKPRPKSREW